MGIAKFPVPQDIDQLLALINATNIPNISIIESDGQVHGWKINPELPTQITKNDTTVEIIAGDQLLYKADEEKEARDFLYGVFYAFYSGKSIELINNEGEVLRKLKSKGYADIILELDRFHSQH